MYLGKNSFLGFLVTKKMENLIFIFGFSFSICAYSFWKQLANVLCLNNEQAYQLFFVLISISFFFYALAYFLTKYNSWKWFPSFVTLVCFSRIMQEVFYPELAQTYDWMEYLNFVITALIVLFYYIKYQYKKYKQ